MVLVKGAGELGTAVAWRLIRTGFPVVMTEVNSPLAVRRLVSFSEAVPLGQTTVEGITARLVAHPAEVGGVVSTGSAAVLVDPHASHRVALQPSVLIDATMMKRSPGTTITDAEAVIGLGPGFTAGVNCHAVVETQRGPSLGRVYYSGSAQADTGIPAERGGHSVDRVIRAETDGIFMSMCDIGTQVEPGATLGHIAPSAAADISSAESGSRGIAVRASIAGVIRGLIRNGTSVSTGLKIGDIDPVATRDDCSRITDKGLSVAGGVLEAILVLTHRHWR